MRRHDYIDRGDDKSVSVGRDEWKLELEECGLRTVARLVDS